MTCNADLNPNDFPIKRIGTKYKCSCCGTEAKIAYKIPCYTEGYGIFPDKQYDEFVLRYYKIIRRYNAERGIYDEVREEMRETFCDGFVYTEQNCEGNWRACNNNRTYYYQYSNLGHWQGFSFTPRADYQRLYTSSLNIYAKGTQYKRINVKEFFKGMDYKKWWIVYSNMFDLMSYGLFAEYMQKTGLNNLLKEWRDNKFDFKVDCNKKKLREMLNITQPQYKELLTLGDKASAEHLSKFHYINEWNLKTEEDWDIFNKYIRRQIDYRVKDFKELYALSLHKFGKYVKDQGDKFNFSLYVDYLRLAKNLNLDLKNTFVIFPKYLKQAHDGLADMYNEMKFTIKLNNYAQKADEKANEFAEIVKASEKWCSADEQFEIISPKSTHDLGLEGIALRHCVAMYVEDIINGEKVVMFLRRKSEPEKPFYTMEIIGNTITQCKGYRNTDRTEDVDVFLHKYAKKMNLKITDNEAYQAFV